MGAGPLSRACGGATARKRSGSHRTGIGAGPANGRTRIGRHHQRFVDRESAAGSMAGSLWRVQGIRDELLDGAGRGTGSTRSAGPNPLPRPHRHGIQPDRGGPCGARRPLDVHERRRMRRHRAARARTKAALRDRRMAEPDCRLCRPARPAGLGHAREWVADGPKTRLYIAPCAARPFVG